jgi:DNA repair exonuclease SbcCD ATPase subunit
MKTIKLKSLTLKNFKGFTGERTYFFDGDDVNIYGDNATGKSTIVDSFLWLLFNKNSSGATDFSVKPLSANGEPLHNVDYSVSAVFEVSEDGKTYKTELTKVMREKWTKKRGETTSNFSGHETTYFKDGSPKLLKEYQKEVEKLCDEELFKMLTSPFYFNKMSTKSKRAFLLKAIPDVSNYDVVEKYPNLYPLLQELGNLSVEEVLAKYKATASAANKDLPSYGYKIEELQSMITTPDEMEDLEIISKLNAQINEKNEYILELQSQKNLFTNTALIDKLNVELSELKKLLQELEFNVSQKKNTAILEKTNEITSWQKIKFDNNNEVLKLKNEIYLLEQDIQDLENEVKEVDSQINITYGKCEEIDNETFNGITVCPTCNQPLPQDQIENAIELFNVDKASRLEKTILKGKKLVTNLHELELKLKNKNSDLKAKKFDLEIAQNELNSTNSTLQILEQERKELELVTVPVTDEMLEVKQKIEDKLGELTYAKTSDSSRIDIDDKVIEQQTELEKLYSEKQKIENNTVLRRRIERLALDQQKVARDYHEAMDKVALVEKFLKAKIELITEDINKLFTHVNFKMFREQINGGFEEVCIATIDGVPFEDANNAAKINAGLDIIKTLQKIENFNAPIFIDNAESVTSFEELENTQLIKLYVREGVNPLQVEVK